MFEKQRILKRQVWETKVFERKSLRNQGLKKRKFEILGILKEKACETNDLERQSLRDQAF